MDTKNIQRQFNLYADKYDAQRRRVIPCFDDFYKRSVSLLKLYRSDFTNIVDLGAGTGLLTKELYELYPNAHFTLIDVSNDMLQIAKDRFHGLANFEFIATDYSENIPVNTCDLICSALSVHHLDDKLKAKLYQNIYKKLPPGGCLINLDQFNAASETINALYDKWWQDYIDAGGMNAELPQWAERRKLDRENTIAETLMLLNTSGFAHAECIYGFMKFGVIVGIK